MNKEELVIDDNWDIVIEPRKGLLNLELKQVWRYKDLLMLLVRRDFVANYKQTILGPLWFFIQPLITSITFLVVFGKIAKIPTDGVPPILFYLGGLTVWNYFSGCLTASSNTFRANSNLFSKVYFPRIILPLQTTISNLLKFGVQLILFLAVLLYVKLVQGNGVVQVQYAYLPLIILQILSMAMLGIGLGMIISSATTKYKDATFLVGFGVQLLMYATPVIYPASQLPEKYRDLILTINPLAGIVEGFKFIFTGTGVLSPIDLVKNFFVCLVVFFIGVVVFKRVEKSFVDVV